MAGSFVLPEAENITISGDAARRLIGCGSGDAALLYIYILSSGGRYDREEAERLIGRSEAQLSTAMDVLTRLGLVKLRDGEAPQKLEKPEELPKYSAADIEREIENGTVFRDLVTEVQRALGCHLTSEGLVTLFGIYDYLSLPPEVILQLVTHCLEEYERRYGAGRRPSMRYIEKTAYVWEREGIFSLEAAEGYLKRLESLRAGESELAPVLGLSGRPLSATERRYLNSWTEMGFGAEAVSMAYDRTVIKTGRLTWRYMDSILKSWRQKGLMTPAEIEAGDAPAYRREDKKPAPRGDSAATAEDLEQMREALRKIKGE